MTLTIYSPPNAFPFLDAAPISIFLAGSIEMGSAEDWQTGVIKMLEDLSVELGEDIDVFNPRRKDWDASWVQSIDNDDFRGQVEWELYGLDLATKIIMYFDPNSKSPISLLELGLILGKYPEKLRIICPEGFYRKGNVDITCAQYGVHVYNTIEEALEL